MLCFWTLWCADTACEAESTYKRVRQVQMAAGPHCESCHLEAFIVFHNIYSGAHQFRPEFINCAVLQCCCDMRGVCHSCSEYPLPLHPLLLLACRPLMWCGS